MICFLLNLPHRAAVATVRKNRPAIPLYSPGDVAFCQITKRLFPFSLLVISGCSLWLETPSDTAPFSQSEFQKLELSIFATRGSLLSRDFERFVIRESALFQECGSLVTSASRPNDDSDAGKESKEEKEEGVQKNEISKFPQLALGRFALDRKSIDARYLSRPEAFALQRATNRVISVNNEHLANSLLTPPDFKTSGLFELTIREGDAPPIVIATSFDTIADSSDPQSSAVQRLYQLVRAFAQEHCGRQAFFGVAKRRD